MCTFRIYLHVGALLWCLRVARGGRIVHANIDEEEQSVCTDEVVQNTCAIFPAQRDSSAKRLAQALAAEEEDVADLLTVFGIATDDFSCEQLCDLAVAQVPSIFGFPFSLFAELARLRVAPEQAHAAANEMAEESLHENQKDFESGKGKERRRQILMDKLLRAMFGVVNGGDVELKDMRNESVALLQHSEAQEALPLLRQRPQNAPRRDQFVWKTTFPRPRNPVESNSREHLAKYQEYVKNCVEKVKVVVSQMERMSNVQASLKKWFHTKKSDEQQVFHHVRQIMNALLKVFGNVKFVENQHSCQVETLAAVHQVIPGRVVEGVQVCGSQEHITDGHFIIHVCPYFWALWHFEPIATILHEATHVLCTKDNAYCQLGIQCHMLSAAEARNNADSYAYFINEVYWKSFIPR